ncbi:MAG: chorismate synthase [Flavobacteriales bacterium]
MAVNRIGRMLTLTSFGESHGPAIGGVLDGVPAGMPVNLEEVNEFMQRRRPGRSPYSSPRNEADAIEWLSGLYNGHTLGSPIAFIIRNTDARPADYADLENVFRPSHADYTYAAKYGVRDARGGGRSSARETAVRVAAGALLMPWLNSLGIQIQAYVAQIGPHCSPQKAYSNHEIYSSPVHCPDAATAELMIQAIEQAKAEGNSLGGVVQCTVLGLPVGLGAPVYAKFHADMGAAMLSINAVRGIEWGEGFDMASKTGAEVNDAFVNAAGSIETKTNHSAGVQGGITNGMPVQFRVAFKPTSTIAQAQETINQKGESVTLQATGRHDPCVLPRAVPIVEAMAALVVADHLLAAKAYANLWNE